MKIIDGYHQKVQKAIAESGRTATEIARLMECDRKVLSSTSNCMMSALHLSKFCAITGVSADYILGLKGDPGSSSPMAEAS